MVNKDKAVESLMGLTVEDLTDWLLHDKLNSLTIILTNNHTEDNEFEIEVLLNPPPPVLN